MPSHGHVRSLGERIEALVRASWSRLKEADYYLRAKAAVVGGYLGGCALSFAIVLGVRGNNYDEIGAKVTVVENPLVGGNSLSVWNIGDEDWSDVLVRVDGEYTYRRSRLKAGGRTTVGISDMVKGELRAVGPGGMRMRRRGQGLQYGPERHMPRVVEIDCDKGGFRRILRAD
jgi:hypothetical protein